MDMRSEKYPYRLDVERRLPNGSLRQTAMRHGIGRVSALRDMRAAMFWGERIDRTDWENWRINYR